MIDHKKNALDFIAHFRKSWPEDFSMLSDYLDENAYYQMVTPTIAAVQGRDAILKALEAMKKKVPDQKHDMINCAASGKVVFTERVDHSFRNGKWVPVPLVAIFELNDAGKIIAWREYLDIYNNLKQHGVSFDEIEKTIAV